MKTSGINLKRGDRIRVRTSTISEDAQRVGEVIAVVRIPACAWGELHVAVRYLDAGQINFECIPLTQVEGLCEDEIT